MNVRLLLIGAAALAVAGAASAQSAPASGGQAPQGATPADMVVAASAASDIESDDDTANAEAQPAAVTPAKPRRAARVTTCRCGDASPSGQ